MEKLDPRNLSFRKLSLLDVREFKEAAKESVETNFEYLAYGALFKDIQPFEYLNFYLGMLKSSSADHFGLFDGGTLLGHVSYQLGFSNFGIELMGWTRKDYQNHGVGELGLLAASERAFGLKNFNFVQLSINEKNLPSRKVAEKVGFLPVLKIPYDNSSPDSMIIYLKLSPRTIRLARQYGRRPLDVMACPASALGMTHFLNSDRVIQFYEWPFPPFVEGARPTNPYYFEDYVARMNFGPRNFEGEP
jgi:RimJ/RimL family protein N-acetyltransferase